MIELLEALLGAILLTIGLLAIVFAGLQRREGRRDRTALWFGLFVVLYGIRMTTRSMLVRIALGAADPTWDAVDAVLTYVTPLPAGLLTESLLGRGRWNLIRRAWQAFAAYAVLACALDLITQRPGAGLVLNAPFVLTASVILLADVAPRVRRGGVIPQAMPALVGAGVFLAIALVNTLKIDTGMESADLLEGVGVLALVSGLGYLVAVRALDSERRLIGFSRELELAREIQQSILPAEVPSGGRLRMGARYLPAGHVAGDFYDYVELGDDRFALIVADVSGHGVPAALIASMVKVAFASAAAEHGSDPAAVLASINTTLCGKFQRAYVTATCAFCDAAASTVTYANAGHPPPLLRRASGVVEPLDAGGMMLAYEPAATYRAASRHLAPGDAVVFFSDGLSEALDPAGEFFGDDALGRALARSAGGAAPELAEHIERELRAWTAGAELEDDVTIVTISYDAAAVRQR
ncbi:MAG TPA: PP2C family protein-serine/threonine phosphatase [Vicinamibacterales bacterium]